MCPVVLWAPLARVSDSAVRSRPGGLAVSAGPASGRRSLDLLCQRICNDTLRSHWMESTRPLWACGAHLSKGLTLLARFDISAWPRRRSPMAAADRSTCTLGRCEASGSNHSACAPGTPSASLEATGSTCSLESASATLRWHEASGSTFGTRPVRPAGATDMDGNTYTRTKHVQQDVWLAIRDPTSSVR